MKTYYCAPKPSPPIFIRTKTPNNVANAEQTIKDYYHWGLITLDDKEEALIKIEEAKNDDAVSNIMTKMRHKAFGKYERK